VENNNQGVMSDPNESTNLGEVGLCRSLGGGGKGRRGKRGEKGGKERKRRSGNHRG